MVRIAAPASPFPATPFKRGVRLLQKQGFKVRYRKDIFANHRHLAGDDKRRLAELKEALTDTESQALLFARGGYGTQRLLPLLGKVRPAPKVIVGLSDLTVLLGFLWQKYSLPSLYGPLVAPHLENTKNTVRLGQALTQAKFFSKQRITAQEVLKNGSATGTLMGGCLSLIVSTLGTPYECDTKGSILFLEDTHEEPYAVDRMLTQLKQAGKFKGVRGIVLGTFRLRGVLFPNKIREVVLDCLRDFRGPILWGVRFGHCPDPLIIPFGVPGKIDGKRLLITKGFFS